MTCDMLTEVLRIHCLGKTKRGECKIHGRRSMLEANIRKQQVPLADVMEIRDKMLLGEEIAAKRQAEKQITDLLKFKPGDRITWYASIGCFPRHKFGVVKRIGKKYYMVEEVQQYSSEEQHGPADSSWRTHPKWDVPLGIVRVKAYQPREYVESERYMCANYG